MKVSAGLILLIAALAPTALATTPAGEPKGATALHIVGNHLQNAATGHAAQAEHHLDNSFGHPEIAPPPGHNTHLSAAEASTVKSKNLRAQASKFRMIGNKMAEPKNHRRAPAFELIGADATHEYYKRFIDLDEDLYDY
jgi:hypothetical protein